MQKIKFLHTADLHIGNPFSDSYFSDQQIKTRRLDLTECFYRILDLVVEKNVDFLVIAGDLFEEERISPNELKSLSERLGLLAPRRVFIVPGNHDFYQPGCAYEWIDWPKNVLIFRNEFFERYDIEGLNLSIYGSAFTKQEDPVNHLSKFKTGEGLENKIVVYHGSLTPRIEDFNPYRPFALQDLSALNVEYIALGHYHKPAQYKNEKGDIIASYPGSPEPLGFDEVYDNSVNLVTIHSGKVDLKLIPTAKRKYQYIEIDCSDLKTDMDILNQCRETSKHQADFKDILCFRLIGVIDPFQVVSSDSIRDELIRSYFAVRVDNLTTPDFDVETIAAEGTIRGHFAREVEKQIEKSVSSGDADRAKVLKESLYHGLTALSGKQPNKR